MVEHQTGWLQHSWPIGPVRAVEQPDHVDARGTPELIESSDAHTKAGCELENPPAKLRGGATLLPAQPAQLPLVVIGAVASAASREGWEHEVAVGDCGLTVFGCVS